MPPSPYVRESLNAGLATQTKEDLDAGLVRNVRVLGPRSKNGRRYPANVIKSALPLYDGAACNIDHKTDPTVDTSTRSRFGRFKNPRQTEDGGIIADLRFNVEHSYAKEFRWWAENDPSAIAFSHFALLKRSPKLENGSWVEVVESIDQVLSVDIVADAGTTNGIYESLNPGASSMDPKEIGKTLTTADAIKAFIMDLLGASPLTADEKMAVAEDIVSGMDSAAPSADPASPTATESNRLARLARRGKVGAWFAAKIAADAATQAAITESNRKKTRVIEIAKEVGLPQTAVTESLVSTLSNLAEESAKLVLTDMKKAIPSGSTTPTNVPPSTTPPATNKSVADLVAELWK